MSVSIVLVPLAFAAIAASKAVRSEEESGTVSCRVNTRMRDPELLEGALVGMGARVQNRSSESIDFDLNEGQATMRRDDDGIWSAHFSPGFDIDEALAAVKGIDDAYGLLVQSEILKRIRDRAPEAGLRVESESIDTDSSVLLMLSVN